MHQYKSAKIYFCFAVLLLVAKPFLGFTMFSRVNPPAYETILVKAFTKRKQEYAEDSSFDIAAIVKKLANPVEAVFLRFSFFLNILFPAIFNAGINITARFLNQIQISLSARSNAYLLNGSLLI